MNSVDPTANRTAGIRRSSSETGLEEKDYLLAQHLWMNGAPLKPIAARVNAPVKSIEAYLASRRSLNCATPPIPSGSLTSSFVQILPETPAFVAVSSHRQKRPPSQVNCSKHATSNTPKPSDN